MDEKVIVVDENGQEVKVTAKEKAKKLLSQAKEKVSDVVDWSVENPKEAFAAATGIAGAVFGLTKMLPKKTVTQKERERIDTTYYDPSTGLHWELTRKLTNAERARLAEAKRQGVPVERVLSAMGVLAR